MNFDVHELTKAIERHGKVARVVVVAVQGSTPREVGASMLVWDGGQSGTIGGGALEYDAANRALDGSNIVTVPLGPSLGQCCGGQVTLVTEVFNRAPQDTSYFTRKIKGFSEKPFSISRQEEAARKGDIPQFVFENGWLFEPIKTAQTPIWIYGSGHVGRALVNTLAPIPGYCIVWIDTCPERFPNGWPEGVEQLIAERPGLTVNYAPSDAIHLILTHSHALDLDLCHRLLQHDFAYAGLIGSKTKWKRFQSRLRDLGHSDAQISRITCPIGDPSLGKHPQEIAVGVASSLLSRRMAASLQKAQTI